jgi:hypothetical protein
MDKILTTMYLSPIQINTNLANENIENNRSKNVIINEKIRVFTNDGKRQYFQIKYYINTS